MPILCMSPSDRFVFIETGQLAAKYNEVVIDFDIDNIHQLDEIKDERLTVLGHGNRTHFGDARLTAKMLVAHLVSIGLPITIKIIDLAGCGIGEADDVKSFVAEFTEELHKFPQYRHIQVNAFCNLVSEQPVAEVCLFSGFGTSNLHLTGMTTEAKRDYDAALAAALDTEPTRSLKAAADDYLEQKVAIAAMIREHKLQLADNDITREMTRLQSSLPTADTADAAKINAQLTVLQAELEEYKKTSAERIKELSLSYKQCGELAKKFQDKFQQERLVIVEKLLGKFSHTFYKGDDIRRSLDNNSNFHHTAEIAANLARISKPRKLTLQLINTRIAELKEELFQEKTSYRATRLFSHLFSLSLPESHESLQYQIKELEKLRNVVKDPEQPLAAVHLALAEALHDVKLNTAKNKAAAAKVLNVLDAKQGDLERLWQDSRKTLYL